MISVSSSFTFFCPAISSNPISDTNRFSFDDTLISSFVKYASSMMQFAHSSSFIIFHFKEICLCSFFKLDMRAFLSLSISFKNFLLFLETEHLIYVISSFDFIASYILVNSCFGSFCFIYFALI